MKRLIFLFATVSFFTQVSNAQIHKESFQWCTDTIIHNPALGSYLYSTQFDEFLTFDKELSLLNEPRSYTATMLYRTPGPKLFVQIDSCLYHINIHTYSNVDKAWIRSITVITNKTEKEKYGCKGKSGIFLVRLYNQYEDDFLIGKIPANPIKIK